jgi:hypothetical protein
LLVDEEALFKAEEESFADADVRAGRKEREVAKRDELDRKYVHVLGNGSGSYTHPVHEDGSESLPNTPA